MAVYSFDRGYIFFANPQTASKAISATLEACLDGISLHKGIPSEQRAAHRKLHHMTYDDVISAGLLSATDIMPLLKVTGIRNPWDLLVSRYIKRSQRFVDQASSYKWVNRADKTKVQDTIQSAAGLSFTEWLDDSVGHKTKSGASKSFLNHADMVIRFESVQDDFDLFLKRLGVEPTIAVQERNVTSQRLDTSSPVPVKRHYTEYYDSTSRRLVERLYKPVIDRFGYTFG